MGAAAFRCGRTDRLPGTTGSTSHDCWASWPAWPITSSVEGGCPDLDPFRGSGCGAKLTCNRLVRLAKTVRLPAPLIAAVRCHSPSSRTKQVHLQLERASPAAQPTSPRHKRSRSSSIGSLKPAGRDTRADVRIKALRRARRETGLPGITKLEIRIGVLVAVPNGVMVRCVDMHSGRPALARRLSFLTAIRSLSKRRHREDCTESDGGKKDFHRMFHDGSPELRRCLRQAGARIMDAPPLGCRV
jgi:hypothetical protein